MSEPSDKLMHLTKMEINESIDILEHTDNDWLTGGTLTIKASSVVAWQDGRLATNNSGLGNPRVKESAEQIQTEYNRAVKESKKDE